MENKGLCATCTNDKRCAFLRKFPVIECEEFDICDQIRTRRKEAAISKK